MKENKRSHRVIIITVNFRNWRLTRQLARSALDSAASCASVSLSVLVVNNSEDAEETDGLLGLAAELPNVTVVSVENRGYFAALNRGISCCKRNEGDVVIICNNDIIFDNSFFSSLGTCYYSCGALVVAPRVMRPDGSDQNPHNAERLGVLRRMAFDLYFSNYLAACVLSGVSRMWKRLIGAFQVRPHGNSDRQIAREIEQGVGAIYVLLPKFFDHFSELFYEWFLYGEEACLAWQLRTVGSRVWYEPSLRVVHLESQTLGRLPARATYEFGRASYWGYRHLL